jgi:hypothetical protein
VSRSNVSALSIFVNNFLCRGTQEYVQRLADRMSTSISIAINANNALKIKSYQSKQVFFVFDKEFDIKTSKNLF